MCLSKRVSLPLWFGNGFPRGGVSFIACQIPQRASNGLVNKCFCVSFFYAKGKFALEVAAKALPFYEDYYGIKYPLAKMDLIAIADFCAGAMENWGLVTYRLTLGVFEAYRCNTRKLFVM